MKVSDYIVAFLIERQITDVFGYPGGMVTHLMDSFYRYRDKISAHVNYHEQAAAFAACGYAQATGLPGVAYATSGPGVTNLMTGIANAFFDSIPVIFLTGQVNTHELKGDYQIRQHGFQEMDVVSIVSPITKYCTQITAAEDIRCQLEAAFYWAQEGRPGPVVLDIPMNISRDDIDPCCLEAFDTPPLASSVSVETSVGIIYEEIKNARRPSVILGAGIHSSHMESCTEKWLRKQRLPVLCSLPASDLMACYEHNYGLIGTYGLRHSNFILAKSDCILSLGSRLDIRQIGADHHSFAPGARLVRVDVDGGEFTRKIKADEIDLEINLRQLMPALANTTEPACDFSDWLYTCDKIRQALKNRDIQAPTEIVASISNLVGPDCIITTDVGQNQMWVSQAFRTKGQRVLYSAGHGSMGYSLPAAIGAALGTGKTTVAFTGDGGLQMNLQELQFLARNRLPIKIILLNNRSLGMIRHFQEMYFDSVYVHTQESGGYLSPDFSALSNAFQIPYLRILDVAQLPEIETLFDRPGPAFIEIMLPENTYVFPKLRYGKPGYDQEPALPEDLFNRLIKL